MVNNLTKVLNKMQVAFLEEVESTLLSMNQSRATRINLSEQDKLNIVDDIIADDTIWGDIIDFTSHQIEETNIANRRKEAIVLSPIRLAEKNSYDIYMTMLKDLPPETIVTRKLSAVVAFVDYYQEFLRHPQAASLRESEKYIGRTLEPYTLEPYQTK